MANGRTTTPGLYVGTSGFSYPSWRGTKQGELGAKLNDAFGKPAFYPAGTNARDFLRFYAERLSTVELNTTGYRMPEEAQFRRWAEETPDRFRFAVKMPHPNRLEVFTKRVRGLGERLGPIRIVIQQVRDDELLARLLDSMDPELRWALEFRHESWAGVDTGAAVAVNALDGDAPFRYLRLREPPYDEAALAGWAERIQPVVADGVDVYAYFKHEDEPTAPAYAERLLALCETP
jgi:uncharacterized protein YecE (DUF72 family)